MFAMIQRGLELKLTVNDFIFHISRDEKDADKRLRLQCLGLSEVEWRRVDLFRRLLQVNVLLSMYY